ncbi:hypothetical protein [Brevundimonas sp. UBA7664]|uniref:hypothetical protein n=1 Tax=Brevundimonas sp. UBA7664 TaxID=1946141 RepID=UPI0025B95E96|nr:hypothetical protein [Brevundimonas sp. UBA7664]
MLRIAAPLTALIALAGCAPAPGPTAGSVESRRCFPSGGAYNISRAGSVPVYLRVMTGQTLEVSADEGCLQAGIGAGNALRPLGPENANFCVGDEVTFDVVSPSVIARTCRAEIIRVVPEDEVAGLPNRVRP